MISKLPKSIWISRTSVGTVVRIGLAILATVALAASIVAALVNPVRPPLLPNGGLDSGGLGLNRHDWISKHGAPVLATDQSGQYTIDGVAARVTFDPVRLSRYNLVGSIVLTFPAPVPNEDALAFARRLMPVDAEFQESQTYIQHLGPRFGNEARRKDLYFSPMLARAADFAGESPVASTSSRPPRGSIVIVRTDVPRVQELTIYAALS